MTLTRAAIDYRDLPDGALAIWAATDDPSRYYIDEDGVYYIWDRCHRPARVGGLEDVIDDLEALAGQC